MKQNDIHVPDLRTFDTDSMWQWYLNVHSELKVGTLTPSENKYMADYYHEVGLGQWWRRPFFRKHFAESFNAAARYLLAAPAEGTIVDLGCGTGTQSIFLALGGAKVIGVDMDAEALEIFRKRKLWYEEKLGRSLDIELHQGNVFDLDFSQFGPIRAAFSMFAFNMMQPSENLLDKLTEQMTQGSRLVIIDGNSTSLVSRVFPSRRRDVWSPEVFLREMQSRSLVVSSQVGGVVLPPQLWRLFPYQWIAGMDRQLCKIMFFAISHQVMGQMQAGVGKQSANSSANSSEIVQK